MKHEIKKNLPIAKFWYKGTHTHPVRRTVLIIESNKNYIKGYELRNGNKTTVASKAPIKTYSRSKIAKRENLRAENPLRTKNPQKSTLIRTTLIKIIESGV